MIGRLTGKLVAQESEGAIVVDVGGVGYELLAPLGAAGKAGYDSEGRVTFLVHTHVREDQITLFGFASEEDRSAFRTLLGVSNVGPRTALAVLTALPWNELASAIARKDMARLTSVPGVGKKTAELMLVQLRDKLSSVGRESTNAYVQSRAPAKSELLVGALTKLGYKAAEAERAASAVLEQASDTAKEMGTLVREALVVLAK